MPEFNVTNLIARIWAQQIAAPALCTARGPMGAQNWYKQVSALAPGTGAFWRPLSHATAHDRLSLPLYASVYERSGRLTCRPRHAYGHEPIDLASGHPPR